ncbi:MAG: hypothetical protein KDB53_06085, partial [Planctomycetes bacterium]|nr:hypothetical protein [Planctomycetota bacterium]
MAEKKRSYFGAATFFVFLLIVLLIALMGRYERTRRVERFAEEQARFEALSESLPDMDEVRRLQVVLKYRPQPLDTVARRQVRNITGRRKVYGSDQVLTFLSMAFDGIDFWQDIPCIGVDYGRNREFLGMLAADSMATPRQVRESAALRAQSDSLTGKSMDMLQPVDQEVHKLYGALRTLERGFAETLIMVPPTKRAMASDENADRLTWMHPRDAIAAGHPEEPAKEARVALTDLEKAWKARDMAAVNASAKRLDVACRAMDPTGLMQSEEEIDAELSFSQAAPFVRASWLFFGCAALVLFGALFRVAWVRWLGIISGIVGLALMAWGFYLRITLGFGVAVHNLYESMIAVAFSGMAICIIIDLARKTSWALPAGGLAAFIVLELVDQMSGKFDDAIGAPIAVLANNFWIHIHV